MRHFRNITLPLIIVLASAASMAGQLLVETEIRSGSDGGTQLLVTNNHSATATAMAIEVLWTDGSGTVRAKHNAFPDSLFRSKDAVPPTQIRSFTFGNRVGDEPWFCDVQLKAVVFSDGANFGDEAWVDLLLKRRQAFLKGIESVLASFSSTPRLLGPDLRDNLESKEEQQVSLMKAQGVHQEEILALKLAYLNALGNLDKESDLVDAKVQRLSRYFRAWQARLKDDPTTTPRRDGQ